MASDKMYLQKVITKNQTPKCVSIFPAIQLGEGLWLKIRFHLNFHIL